MGGKTSNASKAKYNAKNYDRIQLVVPKGRKSYLKAHAEKQGESLNSFMSRSADETIERDNASEHPPRK